MQKNDVDPAVYQQQLSEKIHRLKRRFEPFNMPELEVFDSPPLHYRMRAEFRVWHEGDDLYYIMFDPKNKEPYRVDEFPVASALINAVMPRLIAEIKSTPILRKRLFQVDFLSTLSNEIIVSLLYHRPLDDAWVHATKELKRKLSSLGFHIDLIGRARKMKLPIDRDFVIEQLTVGDAVYRYQQTENSFTQPNAKVAEKMLAWAVDCTQNSPHDLLELYCGNGNFSLAKT